MRIKDQKAKQVMVRHVITLSPTENLWKTQNTMSRYRIKKVVVTQNKKTSHWNSDPERYHKIFNS